ncbi:PAS domain-containing sensor histidine kinase [Pelagibius marinus]|uniref:PAS domain-containing sensor histidine kinase n=1 Tax=Pelagibius marinus TaxID=2762760 RepID=UPI001872E9C0|nr:PAS domain-containing sensor histidine kinase [Pelagibius marinus]
MLEAGGLVWPLLLLVALVALVFCVRAALTARKALEASEAQTLAAEGRAKALTHPLRAAPGPQIAAGAGTAPPAAPAAAELLGLPAEAPIGESQLLDALDAGARARVEPALQELHSAGTAFDAEARLKDGSRLLVLRGRRPAGGTGAVWLEDRSVAARREAALKAEAKHLRAVIDCLPMALWLRDGTGKLTDCNRFYAQAVDAEVETVLKDGAELLGRAKAAAAQALAAQAREKGEPCSDSHHVVMGGERHLLEVFELPFGKGETLGLAFDRTQLEEVQAELGRHIRVQSEMLENLSTAIAIYGRDLHLMFFNTAYARLWELEEDFLQSQPHLGDVLEALRERRRFPEFPNFPAYKREVLQKYATLIAQEEELVHLPDGSTLRMVVTPHPFGGILLSYEDVTDRLALERSYNTLTEVQRETIDNLYEGVAVYGADGRLKLFNPGLCEMWHLDVEFLRGEPHVRDVLVKARSLFDIADEDWPAYAEQIITRTTDPDTRSGRIERSDGSAIDWAQVPLPDGGVLFSYVDVTDTLRVERALIERNEALETADRLKSEFIANISYELRTPLNAIIGFAEVLENQFFGELNERQLEYSHAIVQSSQQLIALINDILDLASIEAGYLQLDLQPTDIHSLLESIFTLGRERAHSRNIELKLVCDEEAGELLADGRRLRQALFNLLSNALKFTKEGGVVTIAAKRLPEEVLLEVSDTGIGIPEEDRERVFGKFERGSLETRHSGAGLGLSLVKSLIELHGGRVELESRVGGGTQVICHVPLGQMPLDSGDEDAVDRDVAE